MQGQNRVIKKTGKQIRQGGRQGIRGLEGRQESGNPKNQCRRQTKSNAGELGKYARQSGREQGKQTSLYTVDNEGMSCR